MKCFCTKKNIYFANGKFARPALHFNRILPTLHFYDLFYSRIIVDASIANLFNSVDKVRKTLLIVESLRLIVSLIISVNLKQWLKYWLILVVYGKIAKALTRYLQRMPHL